jgi:Uma2 family endonuclease
MTTVLSPPKTMAEERVVLHGISWQTYECLLEDLVDRSVPHLTYDRGELEIMSPTALHDRIARAIEALVTLTTLEIEVQALSLGSTTFKREDIERGFEPDSCFYTKNESRIRDKKELDLTIDPPPDLVVEIDLTSSTINKLALFANFSVPEVWRYKDGQFEILQLMRGVYRRVDTSSVLPFITSQLLTDFIAESLTLSPLEWKMKVRDWARQVKRSRQQ